MNTSTMNNVYHNKRCNTGNVKVHMYPPPIPLIKSNNNDKPEKYCVKTKLRRYPTSENYDLYELKMALFDNGKPEDFLLFTRNINTNIEPLGTLMVDAKIQYLCTMVRG